MKTNAISIKLALIGCSAIYFAAPALADGHHNGWCHGVGNQHHSSSCSSSISPWFPPQTHTPAVTQQPPKPVTTVQTPPQVTTASVPYVPKRPPDSRHPVAIVQPMPHQPYVERVPEQTPTFTLPGGANIQPPLRPQDQPILQQLPPPLQTPQQSSGSASTNPVVIRPLDAPSFSVISGTATGPIQAPPVQTTIIQSSGVQQPPPLQPQVPQQVPIAIPTPQQSPITAPILQPPLPQPQLPQQVPITVPPAQQPPVVQPVLQPPLVQPPLIPSGGMAVVVLTPLQDPGFSVPGGGQIPAKVENGILLTLQTSPGQMQIPIFHRPRPYTKPVIGPNVTQPPVVLKPLDTPNFVTPGGGQTPILSGNNQTNTYQSGGIPKPNQVDPVLHVPTNSGRHPAHDLPAFDTPAGAAQCLLSGYGRRYWIDEKGARHETGMPATLRGFGPIMRDVPAFTHHSAGCVLLIYRREDRRERN